MGADTFVLYWLDRIVTLLLHRGGGESDGGGGFGLYFRYPFAEMQQLTTWSHMVQGEYICGLEPGNANMQVRLAYLSIHSLPSDGPFNRSEGTESILLM